MAAVALVSVLLLLCHGVEIIPSPVLDPLEVADVDAVSDAISADAHEESELEVEVRVAPKCTKYTDEGIDQLRFVCVYGARVYEQSTGSSNAVGNNWAGTWIPIVVGGMWAKRSVGNFATWPPYPGTGSFNALSGAGFFPYSFDDKPLQCDVPFWMAKYSLPLNHNGLQGLYDVVAPSLDGAGKASLRLFLQRFPSQAHLCGSRAISGGKLVPPPTLKDDNPDVDTRKAQRAAVEALDTRLGTNECSGIAAADARDISGQLDTSKSLKLLIEFNDWLVTQGIAFAHWTTAKQYLLDEEKKCKDGDYVGYGGH